MPGRAVKVFFDGGARPNPGRLEAAVVVRGAIHYFDALGDGGSIDAEWRALIAALELAQALGIADFVLLGDSAIVIDQANCRRPCRTAALRAYRDRFEALGAPRPAAIRRIARTQNLAGIALAARRRRSA